MHAHLNTLNVLTLFAAWLAGVPVRVSHNHSTADRGEGFRAFIKLLLRPTATWFATAYMACGEKAARWLFGNRRVDAGRVTILPNAIDVCKFRYDPLQREQIRQELGLQGKQVIGHIGRFMPQKNHGFLLKCFAQCHASHPQTHLLLAGGGEGIRSAREQAERLGVSDAVCFAGVRNDPWRLYSAMDVFMLPSLYEGVPRGMRRGAGKWTALPCVRPCIDGGGGGRGCYVSALGPLGMDTGTGRGACTCRRGKTRQRLCQRDPKRF